MTAQDKSTSLETENFACSVALGPGWLDLTLPTGTRPEAEALAARTVRENGALAMDIDRVALQADLTERALELNADTPIMVAVCYAQTGEALADLVIDSYRDEDVPRPGREEMGALLTDWSGAKKDDAEVSFLDLPAGPAVRVRTVVRSKQLLGLWSHYHGAVRYGVSVPGVRSVIVVTATWRNNARSDEIAWLVDQLMPTLYVELLDQDGEKPA
jgi:hypothetical protein